MSLEEVRMENKKLAVILIRGKVNMNYSLKKTLEYLRLHKKHSCSVIDDTPENRGMIQKVKDYTTFGYVDSDLFKKMLEKRGETYSKKKKFDCEKISKNYFGKKIKLREFKEEYGVKPFFRLAPPKGGFEKKGIKMPFAKRGALGQREDKIEELIKKML